MVTSLSSALLCVQNGITVLNPLSFKEDLDWGFDGADEIDSNGRVIKGQGAAMLLEKIMADGYDVSAGEREPGINSISAPIKNHEGMLIGALTITGPNIRISNDRVESFKKMLMEGAREISANMGFVDE